MDLELASGRIIREATEDDILAYIQGEDFAILSADANTYIQCAQPKELPYEYVLECQRGSLDEHYWAADGRLTLDRVLSAFRKYLRRDLSWQTDFRWERGVPGSPQREFEKLDRPLSAPEICPATRQRSRTNKKHGHPTKCARQMDTWRFVNRRRCRRSCSVVHPKANGS